MRPRLPRWLPPSAATDLAQLLAGNKPAVRLLIGDRSAQLRCWARTLGLFTCSDRDGYATVSRNPATARRVLDLDRRPGRHTVALGLLLGYPVCCSRAAARAGDEGIDQMQNAIALRRFHGRFRLIDPGGYQQGLAQLSHVPCSHRCEASLSLAMRTRRC